MNRPARVTPLMRPSKLRADPVGEEVRDQAVRGFALGLHRAALGGGNASRDLVQRLHRRRSRQAVVAEAQRPDERAVHDQVGVAADRRGEMRVAAQVRGRSGRNCRRHTRLAPGERSTTSFTSCSCLGAAHAGAGCVLNCPRPQRRPLASEMSSVARNSRSASIFLRRRARRARDRSAANARFQRLGGRDIGEDHEFLDQPVRVEALRRDHAVDACRRA